MHFELWQWGFAMAAGLMVGMSKTGIPGLGILVITLLAQAFGGWNSNGIMLPMLIFGDIFAASWYRQHAQWDKLIRLVPWVLVGVIGGAFALHFIGQSEQRKALLSPIIGILVLVMLALHLLQGMLGSRFSPRSKFAMVSTGAAAGFTTTVSNAAGPIMSIYLAAQRMPKEQFMGTIAWYFFLINLTKVPIYIHQHLFTEETLLVNLCVAPAILVGVYLGRWALIRIPEKAFESSVLVLAALGAVNLLISK